MAEVRRAAGAAAAVCAASGATAVTVALVAGPGPGFAGYVSEAGVAGSGYAGTYRAGVLGLAAGLLLLAVALPVARPPGGGTPPTYRLAAGLLVAAAAGTAGSALVACTTGCPLPPFQRTGLTDLVHGGASIAAVACCVFAMLATAVPPGVPAVRRLSATAVTVALPLSAAVGLAMLLLGRGRVVGLLERVLLADLLLWATVLAILLATGRFPPDG